METKIWEFAENDTVDLETPYEILTKYASRLIEDTGFIEGDVTEVISDTSDEVVYALYLVVPDLKNYSYRLIEVVQPNVFTFYPVKMKLFGKADGSAVEETDVDHDNFEPKLIDFIGNSITKGILKNLKKHVEVAKKLDL